MLSKSLSRSVQTFQSAGRNRTLCWEVFEIRLLYKVFCFFFSRGNNVLYWSVPSLCNLHFAVYNCVWFDVGMYLYAKIEYYDDRGALGSFFCTSILSFFSNVSHIFLLSFTPIRINSNCLATCCWDMPISNMLLYMTLLLTKRWRGLGNIPIFTLD